MKYFILIVLCFLGCSVATNKYPSDKRENLFLNIDEDNLVRILSKNKELEYINLTELPFYHQGFTDSESKDSILLRKITLSKEMDVNVYVYKYQPREYHIYHEEYLEINNIKYSIDSLLRLEHNEIIEQHPYIFWRKTCSFFFNKHEYLLVQGQSRNIYSHEGIISYLLFDFIDNKLENVWLFYNGYLSKSIFNDFDDDGNLDYLRWGLNMKQIDLLHIIGNKLMKDSQNYLVVTPSEDQYKDWKNGKMDWYSKVNLLKSKWFKDI